MDRGPIPLNMHAALEPFIALVIIAAPWIFGFSETDSATVICVLVGVVMLLVGSMTDWRMSLMRVIPLRMHMIGDLTLGAVLLLSPLVFGFADEGGPTRFMVIAGLLEVMTALMTRWDRTEAEPTYTREHGTTAH
ncbi:MAG TPA: SPW repeat protein [Solirubrobacterales bacterium]|nr:SPW repeat protein [Solirubrobacterales bacterium]